MMRDYNYWLVLLSVIVSITASYVALEAVYRVREQRRHKRGWYWLAGAALAQGAGIWATHFIAMLGLHLPLPVSYDVPLTLLSLAIATLSAALSFAWVSGRNVRTGSFLLGAVLIGCGIAAMHYLGMAAMKIRPPIRYEPTLFALSVLIVVGASLAALWFTFKLRMESLFAAFWKKAGSAVIMGSSICAMDYIAMGAAQLAPGSVSTAAEQHFDPVSLAVLLGTLALLFLLATLAAAAFTAYAGVRSLIRAHRRFTRTSRQHMTVLATSIAHQLNQPLTAIATYAGAARRCLSHDPPSIDEARASLVEIAEEAHRAGQLIQRIRAFLGGSQGMRSPVNVRRVIQDAVAEIADKAERNKVIVRELAPADLPPVEGDPEQLQQVVLSLVDNAIDSMAHVEGRERLLEVRCGLENGQAIAISVRDSGEGLSQQDAEGDGVFDAFHTSKPGALGMGLALSRSIVEGHGGRLRFTQNEGSGVTAQVTLPLGGENYLEESLTNRLGGGPALEGPARSVTAASAQGDEKA